MRIGISSCLLGEQVRYDGGHRRDAFLTETLGRWVEWVPVCPEIEVGMGAPREAIHLVRAPGGLRLVGTRSGIDHTASMRAYARRRVQTLAQAGLDGYVLKEDSPSCGMAGVRVHDPSGRVPSRDGIGLFAQHVIDALPLLPIEEEGRLDDPRLRDNFVERAFAHRRLRRLFTGRWTVGGLVRFHTAHKLILLAHAPPVYQRMGRLVARAGSLPRADVRREYETEFMGALKAIATPARHTNVLMHMLGYFRRTLDPASRTELLGTIEDYRRGLVPLIVPVTLIRHHVRRFGVAYLADQLYLDPHPKELMLRNHA